MQRHLDGLNAFLNYLYPLFYLYSLYSKLSISRTRFSRRCQKTELYNIKHLNAYMDVKLKKKKQLFLASLQRFCSSSTLSQSWNSSISRTIYVGRLRFRFTQVPIYVLFDMLNCFGTRYSTSFKLFRHHFSFDFIHLYACMSFRSLNMRT